nr:unnamed protein product [Digitaria exilis]
MTVTNGTLTLLALRVLLCCALASTITIFLPLALRPCAHSLSRTILATTGLDPLLISCTSHAATKAPGDRGAAVNKASNGGGRPIVTDDLLRCGEPSLPPHALPPFHCCPPTPEAAVVNFTFPDAAEPLRTRRPAHDAGDDMAKLARAVALMKALPASDPRSFYQQANVHCAYCTGAHRQAGTELPLQIHYSWLFFPFHRAYLYFFERVAARLLDDPSFAVPFWSWDLPEGMRAPPEFFFFSDESSSLYDALRNPRHVPPRLVDLDFSYVEKNITEQEQVDLNLRIMYKAMVTNAKLPSLFHGQPYRAGDRAMPGAGTVELALHNVVHRWTGDLSRPNNENMGAYYSSARDPIFYPHHANSDRLWEVWRGGDIAGGDRRRPRHADFTDPDWLDSSFLFYDEEARLVRVTVRDMLDVEKLRYTYAGVRTPWLDARPPVTGGVSRRRGGPPPLESVRFPVFLDTAVSAAVTRPPRRHDDEVEVLVVEGIEADGAEFVRFDVYVKAMELEKVAGSFVSLKQPGMEAVKTSMSVALDEVMEDLGAEGDDSVTVTLVPVMGRPDLEDESVEAEEEEEEDDEEEDAREVEGEEVEGEYEPEEEEDEEDDEGAEDVPKVWLRGPSTLPPRPPPHLRPEHFPGMVQHAGKYEPAFHFEHYYSTPDQRDTLGRAYNNKAERVKAELWDFYRCEEGTEVRAERNAHRACQKLLHDIHYEARLQAIVHYHAHYEHRKVTKRQAVTMTLEREDFLKKMVDKWCSPEWQERHNIHRDRRLKMAGPSHHQGSRDLTRYAKTWSAAHGNRDCPQFKAWCLAHMGKATDDIDYSEDTPDSAFTNPTIPPRNFDGRVVMEVGGGKKHGQYWMGDSTPRDSAKGAERKRHNLSTHDTGAAADIVSTERTERESLQANLTQMYAWMQSVGTQVFVPPLQLQFQPPPRQSTPGLSAGSNDPAGMVNMSPGVSPAPRVSDWSPWETQQDGQGSQDRDLSNPSQAYNPLSAKVPFFAVSTGPSSRQNYHFFPGPAPASPGVGPMGSLPRAWHVTLGFAESLARGSRQTQLRAPQRRRNAVFAERLHALGKYLRCTRQRLCQPALGKAFAERMILFAESARLTTKSLDPVVDVIPLFCHQTQGRPCASAKAGGKGNGTKGGTGSGEVTLTRRGGAAPLVAAPMAMAGTNGTQAVFGILLCCALVSTVTIFLPLALRPCAHSLSRTILATTGLDPQLISCTGATATKASLPGAIGATVNRAINGGRPIVTDVLRCGEPSLPPHALPPFHCCPPTPASEAVVVNFTFPNPAEPIRTRRPAHDAGDDMAKLERAVALMKALPASDPRSFYQQANVHCAYCTGAHRQAGWSPEMPLQIHYSWLFFPFHRAYLYFFERVAARLLGDPSFAVPFWGWDVPEGMQAPPEFFSDESSSLYDALRNPRHAPPRVVDLDFWCVEKNITCVEKNVTDAEQVELNLRIMYKAMVTNAPLPSLFHGQPYRAGDREMPGAGTVELALHNVVHEWTGDLERPNYEDMGAYYSSARDPIFYPHHANSDRLWEVWRGDAGDQRRPRHADFTDPDWLDSSFLFYDEEARLVRVTVRDVLDVEKLRYTYADVGTPWLGARPPVTPGLRRRRGGPPLESVRFPVFLDAAVSAAVMRPWLPGNVRGQRGDAVEVLVVEGIEADGADFVRFDVYVNAMEHEKISPGAREVAGSFVSLKQPGIELVQTSMRVVLDEVMEDLGAQGDDSMIVTLVPVMGKVRIGGLRVVYMAE